MNNITLKKEQHFNAFRMYRLCFIKRRSSGAMSLAVMNAIFCNCLKKPENFRTSTGFEPVTSQYRCDALTNSYEATDVGRWSFVDSNVPVRNESTMK